MGGYNSGDSSQSSEFIEHTNCPSCGSRDNLAVYSDHKFCFGCNHYEGDTPPTTTTEKIVTNLLTDLEYRDLTVRGLREETCKKWGYAISTMGGESVQVANYRTPQGGKLVAQKVRAPGKSFRILGDSKALPGMLYGAHLWPEGGKMVVVTEGEIDALSVSQAQSLKWPVVSVPNGAHAAAKAVAANLEWLETFETVIWMFDQDDPGLKAAVDCAELLSPGKSKIASLSRKDANEMLTHGEDGQIIDAIWKAKPHRPDGLVYGEELWDQIRTRENMTSTPYPWAGLNEKLHGIRNSELGVLCSGTGIGKSSVCRELAYHLITQGETVGYIALEESVVRTSLGLIGVAISKPIHLDHVFREVSEEELKVGFDKTMGSSQVILYDHFGSMENDRLLSKIRQMVRLGATTIFLDHLSIVVSAMEGGDERRRIDAICTRLRQLVEEMRISMFLVSHLRRGEGRTLEEGGNTSLNLLRGSAGIAQVADFVLGFERNQQGDNPNVMTVRCLKNRYSGETGIATWLEYTRETGRLTETTGGVDDDAAEF